ncbi:hypothetical protein AB0I81_36760 [Nonomuraea sp. NPDC050404]|uniref:hypothetical protein n=1 Tax=Nonomuraea sp. NPDC050404 TaxID=3155783 RepID=UPI003401D564
MARARRWTFERGWWRGRAVLLAVAGTAALQALVTLAPPLGALLALSPIPPLGWAGRGRRRADAVPVRPRPVTGAGVRGGVRIGRVLTPSAPPSCGTWRGPTGRSARRSDRDSSWGRGR